MCVKANELPAKVLEHSVKGSKLHTSEDNDCVEHEREPKFSVFGRWQLEPLRLPRAANGIVPKNERGQVDVWSEKCLLPGTVHLRLSRVFSIAKRLEVDSAPAMVGFEFQNGQEHVVGGGGNGQTLESQQEYVRKTKLDASSTVQEENHEHIFLPEDQSYDEESSLRT